MNKKITSSALAALMIAGSTSFSALAAMANGTVVIGTKAFDLAYANNPANAAEITNAVVAANGAIFIKDFEGNWIDNNTNAKVLASVIPAVTYKSATGVVTEFAAADKDAINASFGVSAIGAKKLKVTFTSAVDTTKAVLTVKKGTVAVSTDKIEFATDKMSATVTTTTNLTKGDYTVTVAGLTEVPLTATVTAADVKVSKINVLSTTAPMNSAAVTISGVNYAANQSAFVNYEVVNQYGEVMTGQTINWTQSTGGKILDNTTDGKLTLGNTVSTGTNFIPGAKLFLTGVHAASGTVVNGEVVIGLESKADVVVFNGVYNKTTSKIEALPAGFTNGKYVLLFEVKDQYGNKMDSPSHTDLVFTSNNPLFISADTSVGVGAYAQASDVTIGDVTYTAVDLVAGSSVSKGGSVSIQVISKVTGKVSIYTMQADALGVIKTLSLSAPSKIVAEGEKIEIPFTAADQFGNAVTKYSAVTTGSGIQLSGGTGTLAFEQQNDGSAKLFFTANVNSGATDASDAPVYLTSLITDGGSFSSLMINVKETAVPVAITGIDADKVTSVATGNFTKIKGNNLIVQDQYGRVMTDAKVEAWLDASANNKIIVSSVYSASGDLSPFTVGVTGSLTDAASKAIDTKSDELVLTAKTTAAGAPVLNTTEKLVFGLSTDGSTTIEASKKSITFTKVDQSAYVSFEVASLGTMYNDSNATTTAAIGFNKTVKVYGVKADGTKVLLPVADYSVSTDGKLLVNPTTNVISDVTTAGYIAGDFLDGTTYKDVKVNVLVTVNDANGAAASILEKELLVSNKAPKVATIAVNEDEVEAGKATANQGAITNTILNSFIDETKDQYGVVIVETPVITITNLTKVTDSGLQVISNGTNAANIIGAKMGDKFTATYKYASGVNVVVVFTVGL